MKQHLGGNETGEEGISTVAILVALLIVVAIGFGGFGGWSYVNYLDQKNNTDRKIGAAVQVAKTEQNTADQASFAELSKQPNTTFTGPSDFGSLSFKFPKTWSVYYGDGDAGNGGRFSAYFNPGHVPTIDNNTQYALRLTIESRSYETIVASYSSLVKKGAVKSSIVSTNGLSGTRIDGQFSSTLAGSLVLFKVRDKTIEIQTDSPSFMNDFNGTVVSSLTFSP